MCVLSFVFRVCRVCWVCFVHLFLSLRSVEVYVSVSCVCVEGLLSFVSVFVRWVCMLTMCESCVFCVCVRVCVVYVFVYLVYWDVLVCVCVRV